VKGQNQEVKKQYLLSFKEGPVPVRSDHGVRKQGDFDRDQQQQLIKKSAKETVSSRISLGLKAL